MKKAIILAAGAGKRLGELTRSIPKCLLPIEFESGNTLLDLSIKFLLDNDILEIIIVTGFGAEVLKTHINHKWKNKASFKYIFNEYYKEYNNIYSACLAKNIWDDETLLLNSDIIYHPFILKNLFCEIKNNSKRKSFLVIDDKKQLTSESMKVKVNSKGEIKQINKALEIKDSFGEYIGITYLRGFERVKFLESLEDNVKNRRLDLYYEDAIAHVLNEVSVFPALTSGKPWTEVDTNEDYKIAKQIANEIKNELSQYTG
ncbi:MAG: hypothetical protein A3I68_09035 [Candidatus Melainabacteria bacterium RIFCSPLOWO2_02_FULL_35_15]|nr:MAG: hypothetical protein A3F80_00180 [Candidatus Melainabacteria bacterium RIFCSPLOWO2_12_FULL_35_11]OGI14396.1 MAG: hypothetical protein A3I68_09035 [Candidatus Melainabacteria bacterium RIFCSPLOWO2_02_FULL_35_15]